ncbi:Heat shock protein Hsp90 [Nitrosococcus oceani ATCC 19707]|uniref:Chaperone protein HtpG n=2 Tax=Nitrosococcus oceani TaxID=1229 RepID=HTPG_NITOC|nr:molecular chaperone HtpG [Nitrosococcus oceani]Q3JAF6.1 RecName: Full=Chaperone protein HtpG; AltName: Full=Heat shock protein HtpG; AltName: Full=High temperature protein G [Nitrosococcus oceani ATCC 19707]KFI19303.1 heat shock protein 90 [Nitrosococcus oceani C-27]ABA58190.1 Heat shock protein Hsp90 [Nitrosococcus oceani ATCC 19707]EDZ67981.1 Hsp90 protein, putative [Nitrosococcus oceani AFC27]GEM20410.1 molecular chaperone HtpG [Nitrosococcus oceani]
MTVASHKETLGFQTEVKQLLNLMIHALYSNKEIFLRELISNGADAADKLRFEALTDDALYEDDSALHIRLSYDKDKRTLTIADNGIGMGRQEVVENIGTIAKSGTRAFLESLSGDQAKDARLIGQFGVGFYSAFIVADKVVLETRRAGFGPEHGVRWESGGAGDYTIETIEKATRGTVVTLHLREGEDEFLDGWRLRHIVTRYSDHIDLPIEIKREIGDEEKSEENGEEWEQINKATALWTLPKNDIKEEEYQAFYKHVAHDFEDPLAWTHNRVEGKLEYTSLLFIPPRAPFDLWERDRTQGIKLYVQRVFIMDDTEQLMPRYLRFVRGVVDSNDLPLNISREILQNNRVIDSIRAGSVKKILGLLEDMAKHEAKKYQSFWKEFGQVMKEGVGEDSGNREQIARLLRFASTHHDTAEQTVSLADYLSRMKEGQDKIYYITADSFPAAKSSPHLEVFRKKGIEVLLLSDRVDEWLVASLPEFEGKSLQSVTKGELDLGHLEDEQEKQQQKEVEEDFQNLVERVKNNLGDKVKEVRVTHRLTDSPVCLVVEQHDMSGYLERLLKEAGQQAPHIQPILELNPAHPIIARLKGEESEENFGDWAHLLFEQALLAEGGRLEEPALFVKRLNSLLLAMAD